MSVFAFAHKELKELLRDRRAVFLTFVLPMFIYPATFSFSTLLQQRESAKEGVRVYDVAVTGSASLRGAIDADERLAVVDRADTTGLRDEVRAQQIEAWVLGPDELAAAGGATPHVSVVFVGSRPSSEIARDRLREVLEETRRRDAIARWQAAGGAGDPEDLVTFEEVDVATATESGGARVGRLLPMFLIMTLFFAGSALAVDIVAGEKERGTLETLFLSPVPRGTIAASKYMVAAGAMLVAGIGNVASLAFCYSRGWIDTRGGHEPIELSATGVIMSFVLIVPLALVIGGLLLGVSAKARSMKEGQFHVMPVTLLALVPALFASSQEVRLGYFTAAIPVANVALAVRDGFLGTLSWSLFAAVFVASLGWGLLAMRWATAILTREDTILGFDPEPTFGRTRAGRRRSAILGMALTVLVFFYVGQWMQARDLEIGLALSLWVLLPVCAALTLRFAWSGGRLPDLLSLRAPRPQEALGAIMLGAGMLMPILGVIEHLQSRFLPMPEFTMDWAEDLGGERRVLTFFLIAVTPGICEELTFRGAFLGLLRRTGTTRAAVLLSSIFFGVIHLSVFRFLPTLLLGLILGFLTVRTRSIVPAMLFHMVYNGLAFAWADSLAEPSIHVAVLWGGSMALLAAGLVLVRSGSRAAD